MMKIKSIIIFCAVILCGYFVNARPETDAVYHKIVRSYTLNDDGSTDFHFRKELQLFTTASFDIYGETFIMYNPDFEELTINEAYVIREDGSIVKTPENAFNPSLPSSCTDCERFSRFREMVVTHTALEINATIVLDYTIHSKHPFMPALMEELNLYTQEPVEIYDISVTVPEDITLHYFTTYNGSNMLRNGKRGNNNSVTTHWQFTNLPACPTNYLLPQSDKPTLSFSTLSGPEEFAMNLSAQNSLIAYTYSEYDDVFAQILNDSMSDLDQILAIRDYVADNIRLNNIPARYLDYIVASPHVTWQTHCGTALEKTLLLQSMLRAKHYNAMAGFWAENMMRDIDGVVRVSILDRTIYLSATKKNRLSLESTKAPCQFVSFLGDITFCKPIKRNINVEANVNVSKEADAVEANVDYKFCDIQSPLINTIRDSKPNPTYAAITDLGSNYYQLHINDGNYGIDIDASELARNRKEAVVVPLTDEVYTYHITLPIGATWLTQPVEYKFDHNFGSMIVSIDIDGQNMTLKRALHLKKATILPKEYSDFRNMMTHWEVTPKMMFKCQ